MAKEEGIVGLLFSHHPGPGITPVPLVLFYGHQDHRSSQNASPNRPSMSHTGPQAADGHSCAQVWRPSSSTESLFLGYGHCHYDVLRWKQWLILAVFGLERPRPSFHPQKKRKRRQPKIYDVRAKREKWSFSFQVTV